MPGDPAGDPAGDPEPMTNRAAAASGTSTGRGRAAAGYRKEAANRGKAAAGGAELAAEGLPILTGGKYQGKGLHGRRNRKERNGERCGHICLM